jgi:Ca2+-binding EF-hand superfamily protein
MDRDRDGRLSTDEFKRGVEERLKLRFAPALLDAVVKHVDGDSDGYIDYQDFLEQFKKASEEEKGEADNLTDLELCRALLEHHAGNVARAFQNIDANQDGRISSEELLDGLRNAGVQVSRMRVDKMIDNMDLDSNRFLDYREFLKQFSRIDMAILSKTRFDAVGREIQDVCERLREKFDDAKQAFHAFDTDRDGRLSFSEFKEGVGKFVSGNDAQQHLELVVKMFERADGSGDGYVAYHEFLHSFSIKPKISQSSALDRAVREFLREKFPGSITAAFQALDRDEDNRLSKHDLREGLRVLGMAIEDHDVDALMKRADYDEDNHIDYLEFLVRFGLETKAEGKWEYKPVETPTISVRDAEAAKPFRARVLPSRWHGRGGICAIFRRFDADKDGKLSRREFESAVKDGLGMDVSNSELEAVVGSMDRPFWDAKKMKLDIEKFVQTFIDVQCHRELALYNVLLVRNRWLDLLHAFESFGSAGSGDGPLISKANFSAALQKLVDKGLIDAAERTAIILKAVEDGRFEASGRFVGYIDYMNSFLRHYIGDEMAIYNIVSPVWEDWARKLDQYGGVVTHAQFREVCSGFTFSHPLTPTQIEALIDVIDRDGDGTVTRTELVRRYARDDALLMSALRNHWLALLGMLDAARRPGNADKTLTTQDMQVVLQRAAESNIMGDVTKDHIPEIVANIDGALLTDTGHVRYEEWINKYAHRYFTVHRAFQGHVHDGSNRTVWDALIAVFEMLDATRGSDGDRHEVSWDHFRKALTRARVELDSAQVSRLTEHLDPDMTGRVNWVDFVRGVGEDGDLQSAPYFFNGDLDLQLRVYMKKHWEDVLTACRKCEADARKNAAALMPGNLKDVVPVAELPKYLKNSEALGLGDTLRDGKAKENPLVKKLCAVAQTAFGRRDGDVLRDAKGGALSDYVAMVRYYAGEAYDAESLFERRWEAVIHALQELDVGKDGTVAREALEKRLLSPDLRLSDSMVQFLLKDQPGTLIHYQEMCWRCARPSIVKILSTRWPVLMRGWRSLDTSGSQRLEPSAVRAVLDRVDIGLSDVQVDMLMKHIDTEEDGRYDYHKLLSGKLRGSTYPADAYLGWRALEASWDMITENFAQLDSNADGRVRVHVDMCWWCVGFCLLDFRGSVLHIMLPVRVCIHMRGGGRKKENMAEANGVTKLVMACNGLVAHVRA